MKGTIIFLTGFACGAAGAYFFLKDKFRQYADEEINSVKEVYNMRNEKEEDPVKVKNEKPPIKEYFKKVEDSGYKDYSTKIERPEDPVHKPFNEDPYVIKPDEFGEIEDYEQESLILYSDGVLAYETNDEIFDADEKLMPDFYDHVGEYEDGAVYVRNDIEKTDYAIYKDVRTYEEVSGIKPPHPEDTEE